MISGWNAAKKEEKYVNVFLILDASWTHSKKNKKNLTQLNLFKPIKSSAVPGAIHNPSAKYRRLAH